MRHMRLRLRSSILVILAMLTIFFLITLHTLIWSTNELERLERIPDGPNPPGPVPFWSAINHQNIYDLYATPANVIFKRSSNISQQRIEELFQLVRSARADDIHLADVKKLFPVAEEWNFERLADEHRPPPVSDDNNQQNPDTNVNTANAPNNETKATTTTDPNLTTTEKTVAEYDRVQLRNYVIQKLAKWRKRHQDDKIITLAEIMYDDILKDEPS